jgi:hypothetical protein
MSHSGYHGFVSIGSEEERVGLITLQQAIDHLRLPLEIGSPASDVQSSMMRDLQMKVAQADALILDYLKVSLTSPPDWDADAGTVPTVVQLAALCQLGEIWRFRGDDAAAVDQAPSYESGQLSPQVTNYLRRWRDPAMA